MERLKAESRGGAGPSLRRPLAAAIAISRDIGYNRVDIGGFNMLLVAERRSADYIWLVTHVLDGRNESVTGDVERVPGQSPCGFFGFARAAAATGIWEA
ncbi:hypothetical protein LXM94_14680 [Rhizobium sp. TRM95111]|uniref:hypothetical protein n=1 Tax=Rhizobium alarense TaxID=2846851 RepID=UPI001F15A4B0|nr:hypothetical protein [Rhizobium alarense]MCF3641219.1 hypothetical protein [Rhizobium alarense]